VDVEGGAFEDSGGVAGVRLERVGSSTDGGSVASEGGDVDSVGVLGGGGPLSVAPLDSEVPRFGGDGSAGAVALRFAAGRLAVTRQPACWPHATKVAARA
jgi:hypothetical protein